MSYTIYDNTGNSSSYSANPNDPIPSSQILNGTSQAAWSTGGKKADLQLEIGGAEFDDWSAGISGNTYTFVDGTTAVSTGDVVEVKYDKDDDGTGQDIDVVSIDLGGFDASFELDIKSGQTADRLYLSNVLSFQVAGQPVVNGSPSSPDNNSNLFGEETFRIFDDKANAAATVTYVDANGNVQTISLFLGGGGASEMQVMVDFICFARGTVIETENGPTLIEDMVPGDRVKTKDNGFQRVEWISSRKLTGQDLKRMPHLRPIRFRKGALGDNMPNADLLVSPQHRMLLGDWRCEMLFGANEVLAPSKALVNDRDIVTDYSDDGVEYFHFMCGKHEIVYANGIESESFHPGEFGASTLDAEAREELYVLFPQLRGGLATYGQTARRTLKAFEARLLVDTK